MDPLNLAIGAVGMGPSAADYLRLFTMDVGTDSVTYDATGPSLAPSKRRMSFDLPKVGLASRVLIAVEADFSAVETAGAPAAIGLSPYNAVQRLQVKIGGSGALVDISGVGAHFLNELDHSIASESFQAQPWPTPAGSWDIQHQVYAWDEAGMPPVATTIPARWGYVVPFSLHQGQPLGMLLLGTGKQLATLELTMDDLDAWIVDGTVTPPSKSKVTFTVTVSYEFFEVPEAAAYAQYVQPVLRFAHRLTEDQQDIVSVGPNANVVQLLPFDAILQIVQYPIINKVLDPLAIEAARLRLNRFTVRDELTKEVMWRAQREALGRDIPAVVFDYFARDSLRAAIRATDFTDIRIELDIPTGTTIAAGDRVCTITRKLVDLGASASAG
jgi:hypothetical protein